MHMTVFLRVIAWALPSIMTMATLLGEDWPGYRGVSRTGLSSETAWSSTWPATGPTQRWKVKVGIGSAGWAVAKGRACTLGWIMEADRRNGHETLWCFDSASGASVWQREIPAASFATDHEGGSGATPLIADGRVYALSRAGHLRCHALVDGALVWECDLVKDFGGTPPFYGYTASPWLADGRLIVAPGGMGTSVVALDPVSGKALWKAGDNAAAYASPLPWDIAGRRLLAIFDFDGFAARDAASGAEVARVPWVTLSPRRSSINAAAPVVVGDSVFISTGYGKHGAALVRLDGDALSIAWRSTALRTMYHGAVLHQGHLYGIDADNEFTKPKDSALVCLDAKTGEERWRQPGIGFGAVIAAGDRLLIAGRTGLLTVVEATPTAYRELAQAQIHGGISRTEPALADGRLYLRNTIGEAVCVDLRSTPTQP